MSGCGGRTTDVSVWCYDCHQFTTVAVCEGSGSEHRGHRDADYTRGRTEHAKTCQPTILDRDGDIPLTAWACGCITHGECRFHPNNGVWTWKETTR